MLAPFKQWVKVSNILGSYATTKYHLDASDDAMLFKQSIEQPQVSIDVMLLDEQLQHIQENHLIVKCAAESVLYCGGQCTALRGHMEKLDNTTYNPGNYLSLLKVMANHDPVLKAHLDRPRQSNATYLSGHTQNEIADIIGKSIIQKSILEEVRKAKFFAITVDEITSHNQEIMPPCVRFVDQD